MLIKAKVGLLICFYQINTLKIKPTKNFTFNHKPEHSLPPDEDTHNINLSRDSTWV